MRRLAFIAAASIAFIAIPEPVSAANERECQKCVNPCSRVKDRIKCRQICYEKYGFCGKSKLK